MQFHIGCRADLSPALLERMARYRHAVFVDALGWDLPCRDGLEEDAFDRGDTVYIAAEDASHRIAAFARLVPTTRAYPLAALFPQLLDGQPAPCSDSVWELSRFSATGADVARAQAIGDALSSPLAVALLRHCLRAAQRHHAQRLITVSPLGIESLLRKAGFRADRFAGPVRLAGKRWVVCDIGVRENLLAGAAPAARASVGFPIPAISPAGSASAALAGC